MNNLISALKTKFATSTLADTVGGRIYYAFADTNEYPRVVFHIISAPKEKTFTEVYRNTLIQVDLLSAVSAGDAQIGQMYADLSALLDECSLTITGSTLVWCKEENLVTLNEDLDEPLPDGSSGLHHWAVDYTVRSSLD
jgi:hypothetical protein